MRCSRKRVDSEEIKGSGSALQKLTFPGQGVSEYPKRQGRSARWQRGNWKELVPGNLGMGWRHEHFPEGLPPPPTPQIPTAHVKESPSFVSGQKKLLVINLTRAMEALNKITSFRPGPTSRLGESRTCYLEKCSLNKKSFSPTGRCLKCPNTATNN